VLERDQRRILVGELTRAHLPQRAIAARLGVHHRTVERDQAVLHRYYRSLATAHIDDLVAEEVAKLDSLERVVLERPFLDDDGALVLDTDGVPLLRVLDNDDVMTLLRIAERRTKLLGLDMPTRTETSVTVTVDDARSRALELVAHYGQRRELYDGAIEIEQ
jgi:hypothetical protein